MIFTKTKKFSCGYCRKYESNLWNEMELHHSKCISRPNMNFENNPNNEINPENEFEQAITDVCMDLAETLIRKNRDYGDSYRKMKEEFGDIALIIRQEDKLGRLKSLIGKDNLVNESSSDTKKDGAGYYVLDLACEKVIG